MKDIVHRDLEFDNYLRNKIHCPVKMMLKRYRTKARVNEEMIKKSKQIKMIVKWKYFL